MVDTLSPVQSHTMGMRLQKKILGKMASRSVAKHFIDDEAGLILDKLFLFMKDQSSEVEAKKLTKHIMKIVIKLGILYTNDKFTVTEKQHLKTLLKKFSRMVMTLVTFWEVAFSFDEVHFVHQLREVEECIITLILPHLTEKSEKRVRYVFNYFSDKDVLNYLFNAQPTVHLEVLAPLLRDYVFGKDQNQNT